MVVSLRVLAAARSPAAPSPLRVRQFSSYTPLFPPAEVPESVDALFLSSIFQFITDRNINGAGVAQLV